MHGARGEERSYEYFFSQTFQNWRRRAIVRLFSCNMIAESLCTQKRYVETHRGTATWQMEQSDEMLLEYLGERKSHDTDGEFTLTDGYKYESQVSAW